MAEASITHLRLFLDQGVRRVALFGGPDAERDWLRNDDADALLNTNWDLLPLETLLSVTAVQQQAWSLRAAGLAAQQADQAATANDPGSEAERCSRVAALLEQAAASTGPMQALSERRAAWLLRGVNARLNAWQANQDPAHAEALAALFGQLADGGWSNDDDELARARQNQRFWQQQALEAWSTASQQAEQCGDLAAAEAGAVAVLRQLDTLAA